MSITQHKILEEAKALSAQERAKIATTLLKSLEDQNDEQSLSLIEELEKEIQTLTFSQRFSSVYGL